MIQTPYNLRPRNKINFINDIMIDLQVNNYDFSFMIDTGSPVSSLPMKEFEKLTKDEVVNTKEIGDRNDTNCKYLNVMNFYSKPIILQHFPLFRYSDLNCSHIHKDSNFQQMKPKYDCLSYHASQQIMETLMPRLVLSGHTHSDCHITHKNNINEYTVGSFNWRNTNRPSLLLLSSNSQSYLVKMCHGPDENLILNIYYINIFLMSLSIMFLFGIIIYRNILPTKIIEKMY
ncbi:metallophosphoesterase 1-like isoform X2 [Gordionus sp. m RMFG-2023]|uniref:metallophosphoesterase 1-like isoform X2 n=1 Tax=Gordionus sp. m RMFG-2023 TaxID=3053472 RepID=UPI0031FD3CB1